MFQKLSKQMMQNNPLFKRAEEMAQGKSEQELEQVAGMQNTNALASQLADCCCTTQRSIDSVRYENAKNTCDIVNAIKADGDATRALMTQNEIQSLRDQLQTANFQLSQQAQNATLISAYQTCSPYESAQLFSHYGTACNNGCGC